jgi:hypothetical protein
VLKSFSDNSEHGLGHASMEHSSFSRFFWEIRSEFIRVRIGFIAWHCDGFQPFDLGALETMQKISSGKKSNIRISREEFVIIIWKPNVSTVFVISLVFPPNDDRNDILTGDTI